MSIEIPSAGRATWEDLGNEIRITIPTRRKIFSIIFSCVWLVGWVVGETLASQALFQSQNVDANKSFLVFWLIGWTVGGLLAIGGLFWLLAGKEIVTLSTQFVTIRWDVFGVGYQRQFDMTKVQNIRVATVQIRPTIFELFSTNAPTAPRTLAFDYGMKTVRFAGDIDEAEASHLLEKLKRRFRLS
ncbi:MAG: hypothetical protein AAB305_03245 [Candidatus Zixiibacteriota bacterium]